MSLYLSYSFLLFLSITDSDEVHSEDNKVPLDKSKKRTLKTPAQRDALECFYEGIS